HCNHHNRSQYISVFFQCLHVADNYWQPPSSFRAENFFDSRYFAFRLSGRLRSSLYMPAAFRRVSSSAFSLAVSLSPVNSVEETVLIHSSIPPLRKKVLS